MSESVQFLIAVLCVKHGVDNVEGFEIADFFEAGVVDVACTLINTWSALALMTACEDWLEMFETVEEVRL